MATAAQVKAKLSKKQISPMHVKVGALLGDPGCRALEPDIPPAPKDVPGLFAALDDLEWDDEDRRHVAIVRAVLAAARPILPLAKKRRGHDYGGGFYATETWALCPCEFCVSTLQELCKYGLQPREPLELQIQYHVAGVAIDAAYASRAIAHCRKFVDAATLRKLIAKELVCWALAEGDPVRASIGERVFWTLNPAGWDQGVWSLDLKRLDAKVKAELQRAVRSLDRPNLEGTPPLPVKKGRRREFLPNDLGLLIVSGALKTRLSKLKAPFEFEPLAVAGAGPYWLAWSPTARKCLAEPRHSADQTALLDPNAVVGAPPAFRIEDSFRNLYAVEPDLIYGMLQDGLRLGILANGAPYVLPLKARGRKKR